MLTYNELIELRNKLTNGEISLDLARSQYWSEFKNGQRSWHTKDWKERRSRFIKDKCEICCGTDTLTLQHLSHPRKYSVFHTEVIREISSAFKDFNSEITKSEFKQYILEHYDYVPIPLCSNCKSRNPNKRLRKSPQYFCIECRLESDEIIYKSVDELISTFYETEEAIEVQDKCFVTNDKWKNKHKLSSIRYWMQRDMLMKNYSDMIERESFLLYIDNIIKYLSFEDAITACKKCAACFDLYKMEVCPKCNEFYKGVEYLTCIQCLPEDKRKIALEKVEFGKQWRGMEKDLGID